MAGGLRTVNALWKQEQDVFACSEATAFAPGQLGAVAAVANTTGVDPGPDGTKLVQYVKRRSTDALTLTSGQAVYWADLDNYLVTDTQSAALGGTNAPAIAGFVQSSNPQPGSFGFIQVGGQGLVRVSDSTTASTTANGRPLFAAVNQTFGFVNVAKTAPVGIDITSVIVELAAVAPSFGKAQVGILTGGNSAAGTNLTAEALIGVVRNGW